MTTRRVPLLLALILIGGVSQASAQTQVDLPVTFEDGAVAYTLTDFDGTASVLGPDPANAANMVAVTTKSAGAAPWAGTTIGTQFGFASRIPFTASAATMSINVYSPLAGIPVRLKAEDHRDVTLTVETEATTTVANAWEVLVFDFSNVAPGTNPFNPATSFDKVSIFFNFGTAGANRVYDWDRVTFGTRRSVGVEDLDPSIPHSAAITGSYPSPFDDASTILYSLDRAGLVDVSVYTIQGKKLRRCSRAQPRPVTTPQSGSPKAWLPASTLSVCSPIRVRVQGSLSWFDRPTLHPPS
ncbi:MAG: hypothetical protein ACI80V_002602 [Rhodothermales bacterium]|jgi:hypothetical protein